MTDRSAATAALNAPALEAEIAIFDGDDWVIIYQDGGLIWADHPSGSGGDMIRAYEAVGHTVARCEVSGWEPSCGQWVLSNWPETLVEALAEAAKVGELLDWG